MRFRSTRARHRGWRAAAPAAALIFLAACGTDDDAKPPSGGRTSDPGGAPVSGPLEWIPNTFLARPDDEEWIERIPMARVGEAFLVMIEPQVRSPAEGPWRLTLARAGDPAVSRISGLFVDRATGRLTFLVRTETVTPGDYLILLELEDGGMASGPHSQAFRFRME